MNEHKDQNNKLYTMCKKIQLVKNSYKLILKQQNTNTIQNLTCIIILDIE